LPLDIWNYCRIRIASRRNAQSTFRREGSQGPQIHPDDESDDREKDDGDFDPCEDGTDDGCNPEFDDDDNAANDNGDAHDHGDGHDRIVLRADPMRMDPQKARTET
jgi:hypothetical protein